MPRPIPSVTRAANVPMLAPGLGADPTWIRSVAEHLVGNGAAVLTIGEGVGLLPAHRWTDRTGPVVARAFGLPDLAGADLVDAHLSEPARDLPLLASQLDLLARTGDADLIRFSRVPTRSNLMAALDQMRAAHSLEDCGAVAFIGVQDAAAFGRLSKEQLRNVDRQRRRTERELGPVTRDVVTTSGAVRQAFDRFVALEDSGWKGQTGVGSSLAADPRLRAFMLAVLTGLAAERRARVDILRIADQDAAAHLAVRTGRTWNLLKIAYHPAFRSSGPGGMLFRTFLEEMAADPGVDEVNLSTDPDWARRWHVQVEPCFHVLIHCRTFRGRLIATSANGRRFLRDLRNRMPRKTAPP